MSSVDAEQTYTKCHPGNDIYDTKNLGVIWCKKRDETELKISAEEIQVIKRGILQKCASIYDTLRISSLVTLNGKTIYQRSLWFKYWMGQRITKPTNKELV